MKYFYIKTINNNAVVAMDEARHETIVMGKGIGVRCSRVVGMQIDEYLIERVFTAYTDKQYAETILSQIPYYMFELVDEVIKQAEKEFQVSFKDMLYLPLLDHIYFSYKMQQDNQKVENALINEIKIFHSKEFSVAQKSVKTINAFLNIDFDENEAAYIAFHYINALNGLNNEKDRTMLKLLKQIMTFVNSLVEVKLDPNSYEYSRLMIHFKCLLHHLLSGDEEPEKVNAQFMRDLASQLEVLHQKEWEYAKKIVLYINNELKLPINKEEVAYLTMHIVPLLKK